MPHDIEWYHDDDNFEPIKGEKRAGGRLRLTREYAAALARERKRVTSRIATELRGCGPGHRCGSGICPQCTTAARRKLIDLIQRRLGNEPTALLTVVPADASLQPSKLSQLNAGTHKRELLRKLSVAGLAKMPMIGGLDLSWDTFEGITNARFWSAHWHLIIPDSFAKEAESRLDFIYQPSLTVCDPIKTKPITTTPYKAYSYCLKSVFDARHQRIHDDAHRDKRSKNTIKPSHTKFTSLAIGLDRIGIAARIFDSEQERRKNHERGDLNNHQQTKQCDHTDDESVSRHSLSTEHTEHEDSNETKQ